MAFPHSYTESETDNLLSNKISATGYVSISGNVDAPRLSITNTILKKTLGINNTMPNGPFLVATLHNYDNNILLFALRYRPFNQLWCFGVTTSHQYVISHENSTELSIQSNGNTTISGIVLQFR